MELERERERALVSSFSATSDVAETRAILLIFLTKTFQGFAVSYTITFQ
jgi:hypothetical protein